MDRKLLLVIPDFEHFAINRDDADCETVWVYLREFGDVVRDTSLVAITIASVQCFESTHDTITVGLTIELVVSRMLRHMTPSKKAIILDEAALPFLDHNASTRSYLWMFLA